MSASLFPTGTENTLVYSIFYTALQLLDFTSIPYCTTLPHWTHCLTLLYYHTLSFFYFFDHTPLYCSHSPALWTTLLQSTGLNVTLLISSKWRAKNLGFYWITLSYTSKNSHLAEEVVKCFADFQSPSYFQTWLSFRMTERVVTVVHFQ